MFWAIWLNFFLINLIISKMIEFYGRSKFNDKNLGLISVDGCQDTPALQLITIVTGYIVQVSVC